MSPKYVCPICLMQEHEHHQLIDDGNTRDRTLLAVKRIPILIKRDEDPQMLYSYDNS